LKIATAFVLLHAGLYAEGIIEALMQGVTFDVRWVFHLVVCAFLAFAIARPSKVVFFLLVLYCLVIPTRMLAEQYVAGHGLAETVSFLFRTIVLTAPLYVVALCLVAGSGYYFQAKLGEMPRGSQT
jgi:hypothetical protein